jgi:CheY-like chemotaxis protein
MSHNTTAIRQLLLAVFSDEDFEIFCFDHFRVVHDRLSTGMTLPRKIQVLVRYCDQDNDFERLLKLIRHKNPVQFERYAEFLEPSSPEATTVDPNPAAEPAPSLPSGSRPQAKVLLVDNDLEFLRTRSEFLEQNGFQTRLTGDPVEAKRIIDARQVDIAIVDLRLLNDDDEKDLSGLNLAKSASAAVPKIIMTRFPTVEAVRQSLRKSFDKLPPAVDFVSKQEGPHALLTAVKRALLHRPD